jgi:hypothetical protein
MTNIITPDFRARNATSFVEEVISNTYYTFVSSMEETESLNSEFSKREFLEKTLFGKAVLSEDVFYMVKNNRYTRGLVYDAYDDRDDLTNKTFYVTVFPEDEDTGNYYVFKCLSNNYGAVATDDLVYSPSIPNQTYNTTNDGYTWKYLFTLTNFEFRTLATNNLIPIIEDIVASNNAVDGIETILITNPGESFGYITLDGTVTEVSAVAGNVGNIVIAGLNGAEVSQVANYYAGQSITITKEFGDDAETRLYTIASWLPISQTTGIIELEETVSASPAFIDNTCTFKIIPRVEISGNGTGAKAIPIVDETSGTISAIQILDIGSGYTNATARVVDPLFDFVTSGPNTNANRCIIRPIISPPGGHNFNLKEELLCRHVLINTEISSTDNNIIPTSRTYTKLGLVKNPEFTSEETVFDNRLRVKLESVTGISVDDVLFQIDPSDIVNEIKTFEGKVHSIDGADIYLTNYMGPYVNQANTSISFDDTQPLRNNIGQLFTIATNTLLSVPDVTTSPYVQRTGEVFYINTFNPIERTAFSLEQYKILLQF